MTENARGLKSGDAVRLSPRGVVHIAWGTSTVCGRPIPEGTEAVNVRPYCRRCRSTSVATLTYASGRQDRYYVR